MSPEEWLKAETSRQLGKIIDALNAAHTMPFKCDWLERDLGLNYLVMLKEMESFLLLIWSHLKKNSITEIEHQVMVWYGRHKRSKKNIVSCYYLLQERLNEWASSPEAQSYGLTSKWSDYLMFVMAVDKNHLTKASSGIISLEEKERKAIASLYLKKMQMIFIAEPHQLCIDFFTWISPFTQESVSLPYRINDNLNRKNFNDFKKFQIELNKSDNWSSLCKIYLDIIERVAGKK